MSNPAARRRTELPFTREEWNLLVRLPGRVVVAAASAEPDSARRTVAENLAGIEAVAAGASSGSPLVRDVVAAIYARDDDSGRADLEFAAPRLGIAEVLHECAAAMAVLAERTESVEAAAYRSWLESIARRTCHAARSGGMFGMGGVRESSEERRFLTDLGAVLGR